MANLVPPYLNKSEKKAKNEYKRAQKQELRAKKHYEFRQEYTKLCKDRLDKINEKK